MDFFINRDNFDNYIQSQKSVVLFGASLAGRQALKVLKEKGIKVLFFCDNDTKKHGSYLDGVKICPPSNLFEHREETILVSSDYFGEIFRQLQAMGITKFYYFGFCFDYERWHGHFDSHRFKAYEERIDFASNAGLMPATQ